MKVVGFAFLAAMALIVVACSGGGSLVPQRLGGPVSSLHHHRVRAAIVLRIPSRRRYRRRHHRFGPHYISPGTMSLAFSVQPIASSGPSPTPMPLQTFNVVTPSPCSTIPSSGGALQCQFVVSVMPGSDVFTVATYPSPNAKGSPLSGYTSGVEAIPTADPNGNVTPLAFTLQGVVSSVRMSFSKPASTSQPNVAVVPAATGAPAMSLSVVPLDAAGYEILEPAPAPSATYVPFLAPLTLKVTPADGTVTLSNAHGSGTSLTVTDPSGLANLSAVYNGGLKYSSGTLTDEYAVTAAIGTVSLPSRHANRRATPAGALPSPTASPVPTPQPTPTATAPSDQAVIDLATNAIGVPMTGITLSSPMPGGLVADTTGNTFYGFDETYSMSGAAFAFDSTTGTVKATAALSYQPYDITLDATNNAVWIADYSDSSQSIPYGALRCYTTGLSEAGGSPFVQTASPAVLAWTSSGNLFYADGEPAATVSSQPVTGQCTLNNKTSNFPAPSNTYPTAMAANAANSVSLASAEYFYSSSDNNGSLYTVDGSSGFSSPTALAMPDPTAIYEATSVRQVGSTSDVYAAVAAYTCYSSPCTSYIGRTSGSTMSSLASIPAGGDPHVIMVNGTTVGFTDTIYGSIGLYDTSSNSMQLLPLSQCSVTGSYSYAYSYVEIGGLAFDANGTPWVNCISQPAGTATEQPMMVRVVITHTWSLFANTDTFRCGQPAVVGIGGAQASDSFTVSGTGSFSGATLSNNEVLVTPACTYYSATPGTLTVTETHSGRSQTISSTAYSAGLRHRHARRGYPPFHRN